LRSKNLADLSNQTKKGVDFVKFKLSDLQIYSRKLIEGIKSNDFGSKYYVVNFRNY